MLSLLWWLCSRLHIHKILVQISELHTFFSLVKLFCMDKKRFMRAPKVRSNVTQPPVRAPKVRSYGTYPILHDRAGTFASPLYKDEMLTVRNFFGTHVAPWFLPRSMPDLLYMKRPSLGNTKIF